MQAYTAVASAVSDRLTFRLPSPRSSKFTTRAPLLLTLELALWKCGAANAVPANARATTATVASRIIRRGLLIVLLWYGLSPVARSWGVLRGSPEPLRPDIGRVTGRGGARSSYRRSNTDTDGLSCLPTSLSARRCKAAADILRLSPTRLADTADVRTLHLKRPQRADLSPGRPQGKGAEVGSDSSPVVGHVAESPIATGRGASSGAS